jgi:hypothetical protein
MWIAEILHFYLRVTCNRNSNAEGKGEQSSAPPGNSSAGYDAGIGWGTYWLISFSDFGVLVVNASAVV